MTWLRKVSMVDALQLLKSTQQGDLLRLRHELLKATREFFYRNGYWEVETPNLVKTAPPDPNIEPLSVYAGERGPFFLHTSPEMGMKKLLLLGQSRIFQICKVYRVEEHEEIHNTEFTMLEWYREGTYLDAMDEVERLIVAVAQHFPERVRDHLARPWKVYDLAELFLAQTGMNPFGLDRNSLCGAMSKAGFPGIDERDTWNDLFFKLFIQEVEPKIPRERPYFITDWPATVSTMAKRKDPFRVERFELYMGGMEIANGYTELLDTTEQRRRFQRDNLERQMTGKRIFPIDEAFLHTLSKLEGPYTGVSIGIDRLLMALMGKEYIEEVMINRIIP